MNTQELVIGGSDSQFGACLSLPASHISSNAAVVILPDVRGLFDYYAQLTTRFAAAGHPAIAIDYFGRTAGTERRTADFEYMPHIKATTPVQVRRDIAAAIGALRESVGPTAVATVGFCFGGSQSYLATTDSDLALSGAIAFYGGLDGSRLGVFPNPEQEAASMRGPILGLFGGADPSIPPELIGRFDRALTELAVEHEFVVYEGAPHSFFDRSHGDHAVECEDAWRRVLGFLSNLPVPTSAPDAGELPGG